MIDVTARIALRETINSLLSDELSWDKYDECCQRLETEDESVRDIAWLFWEWTDPEYPSNKDVLTKEMLANVQSFLSSDREYAGRPQESPHGIVSAAVNGILPCSSGYVSNNGENGQECWPFLSKDDSASAPPHPPPKATTNIIKPFHWVKSVGAW